MTINITTDGMTIAVNMCTKFIPLFISLFSLKGYPAGPSAPLVLKITAGKV